MGIGMVILTSDCSFTHVFGSPELYVKLVLANHTTVTPPLQILSNQVWLVRLVVPVTSLLLSTGSNHLYAYKFEIYSTVASDCSGTVINHLFIYVFLLGFVYQ